MKRKLFVAVMVLLVIVLLFIEALFEYYQWKECKEMGMTTFYCIKHIL